MHKPRFTSSLSQTVTLLVSHIEFVLPVAFTAAFMVKTPTIWMTVLQWSNNQMTPMPGTMGAFYLLSMVTVLITLILRVSLEVSLYSSLIGQPASYSTILQIISKPARVISLVFAFILITVTITVASGLVTFLVIFSQIGLNVSWLVLVLQSVVYGLIYAPFSFVAFLIVCSGMKGAQAMNESIRQTRPVYWMLAGMYILTMFATLYIPVLLTQTMMQTQTITLSQANFYSQVLLTHGSGIGLETVRLAVSSGFVAVVYHAVTNTEVAQETDA